LAERQQVQNSYGTLAYKWVIFKLNATIYPNPHVLETDLRLIECDPIGCGVTPNYNHFLFIPVFISNMTTKINCINTYNSYKDKTYIVTAEVNLKDYNGRNLDVYNAITNKGTVMLIFHAVPDASKAQGIFFKNTGAGVYTLKDLLEPGETIDHRSNLNFILGLNFKSITSDNPLGVMSKVFFKPPDGP